MWPDDAKPVVEQRSLTWLLARAILALIAVAAVMWPVLSLALNQMGK